MSSSMSNLRKANLSMGIVILYAFIHNIPKYILKNGRRFYPKSTRAVME